MEDNSVSDRITVSDQHLYIKIQTLYVKNPNKIHSEV